MLSQKQGLHLEDLIVDHIDSFSIHQPVHIRIAYERIFKFLAATVLMLSRHGRRTNDVLHDSTHSLFPMTVLYGTCPMLPFFELKDRRSIHKLVMVSPNNKILGFRLVSLKLSSSNSPYRITSVFHYHTSCTHWSTAVALRSGS